MTQTKNSDVVFFFFFSFVPFPYPDNGCNKFSGGELQICNSGSRWQVTRWPGGQATGGRWHEKIIGKWGIPEKSFKNVAQLR